MDRHTKDRVTKGQRDNRTKRQRDEGTQGQRDKGMETKDKWINEQTDKGK